MCRDLEPHWRASRWSAWRTHLDPPWSRDKAPPDRQSTRREVNPQPKRPPSLWDARPTIPPHQPHPTSPTSPRRAPPGPTCSAEPCKLCKRWDSTPSLQRVGVGLNRTGRRWYRHDTSLQGAVNPAGSTGGVVRGFTSLLEPFPHPLPPPSTPAPPSIPATPFSRPHWIRYRPSLAF